jgi:hypothetical protein
LIIEFACCVISLNFIEGMENRSGVEWRGEESIISHPCPKY